MLMALAPETVDAAMLAQAHGPLVPGLSAVPDRQPRPSTAGANSPAGPRPA
jgi:hypothetical protein